MTKTCEENENKEMFGFSFKRTIEGSLTYLSCPLNSTMEILVVTSIKKTQIKLISRHFGYPQRELSREYPGSESLENSFREFILHEVEPWFQKENQWLMESIYRFMNGQKIFDNVRKNYECQQYGVQSNVE